MNILQIHKYFYHKDGATNYMLNLSHSLEKKGHNVIPFSMKNKKNVKTPYSRFFVSNMKMSNPHQLSLSKKIKYASRIIYSFEANHNIERLLEKVDIDIVHLHNIYHHISPSILPAIKKRKIPTIMTLHDYKLISPNYTLFHHGEIHEEDATGWYSSCPRNKCLKDSHTYSRIVQLEMIFHHKIMKYFDRYIDKFIAPSKFMMKLCIKHGWDKNRFIHIPNPVDTSKFSTSKKNGNYVSYIGRLSEEKGIHILLEAAKQTPKIPYRIVGTGPQAKELKTTVKDQNIQNVTFTGFKSGRDLQREFNQARILVTPSVWYENCPLSILEAKAKGKIVIGSNIGGIPELLPKELLFTAGIAVDLAKKIKLWYSATSSKRQHLGQKLRQEVCKTNNQKQHTNTILELYKNL